MIAALDRADADALVREGCERIFKWGGAANDHRLYKELSDAGFEIAADIATSNQDAKELFYFDMVAAGIWIARRGFVALNIMIGDPEGDRFVSAVEEFVTTRRALIKA